MSNCVVIFPLYKTPNKLELSFLENGLEKTKDHQHIIVAPKSLNIDQSFGKLNNLEVRTFEDYYFEDIAGYNKLLLSEEFYNAFTNFDFMLIHQTDVFLFKDELNFWCDKNYDYIGAPWFRPDKLNKIGIFKIIEHLKLYFKKNKIYAKRHNKVGNGGLSLRKISTALNVLKITPQILLNNYLNTKNLSYNEDIFWSIEAPLILKEYKVPEWKEAMYFAIEFKPSVAYKYLNETLPFGCHAPLKHEPNFWKKFIPQLEKND